MRKTVKSSYQCGLTESCHTTASKLLPLDQILSMVKVKMADTRNTTLPEMRNYAIRNVLESLRLKECEPGMVTPLSPALRRQRQEGLCEFEASLV